jgi:iron complex outermembrane receptor protein
LIYNLNQTSVKLLYGEAFRTPNVYEQFYSTSVFSRANTHLKPENIRTYELVVEHYLGSHLRASAAGYYYTIDGLISQRLDPGDGLAVFQNAGDLEAKGLELGLDGKWESGLEGRLGYAVQLAEDRHTLRALTNSPQHMLKTNLILPLLPDKLFAGLETRYVSERRTLAGRHTRPFFVTNLSSTLSSGRGV